MSRGVWRSGIRIGEKWSRGGQRKELKGVRARERLQRTEGISESTETNREERGLRGVGEAAAAEDEERIDEEQAEYTTE